MFYRRPEFTTIINEGVIVVGENSSLIKLLLRQCFNYLTAEYIVPWPKSDEKKVVIIYSHFLAAKADV